MFERMPDKGNPPTEEQIKSCIGEESLCRLKKLEGILNSRYSLVRELKFPFGLGYGWGYKYSHNSKHLFYLFFEKGAMTATIQIGGAEVKKLESRLGSLLPKTQELWANRYPCGSGGWVHYRIEDDEALSDVIELIAIKKSPVVNRDKKV